MTLGFTITFHGPFGVATGRAGRGADVTVDGDQLRSSSLKGVMRAAATEVVLPHRPDLVAAVFGAPRTPSPWHWTEAALDDAVVRPRARVSIDATTGTAVEAALLLAEEVWADHASFHIFKTGPVKDMDRDTLILRASGAAVHALGMDRRRGLGWVTVTPDPPVDATEVAALTSLRVVDA